MNDETLGRMEADITALKADVAVLKRVVIEGNGNPPLTSQVAKVQTQLGTISKLLWIVVSSSVGILLKLFLF